MKKLLFLIASLEGGGAEKVLLTLVNRLCEKYDITVQTIYDEGLYIDELDSRIRYKSIVYKPTLNKKRIMRRVATYLPSKLVYKCLVGSAYDVSIAFLEGISTNIVSGADGSSRKIAWIHTDIGKVDAKSAGFRSRKDQEKCYDRFSGIVCVSDNAKMSFKNSLNTKREPITILNPVDREKILRMSCDEWKGEQKERFTFCAVGRLVEAKAVERIIKAAFKLHSDGSCFDVWIIGEGDKRASLEAMAESLGIRKHVRFLGFLPNPYPAMRLCDAYVCSSKFEGFSLTVAEALVLGLPVISTQCTGPREILDNGLYGLLVDNSESGIYEGMKTILRSKDVQDNLRSQALVRSESFDIGSVIAAVEHLIDDSIDEV